jgi:chromate transporter
MDQKRNSLWEILKTSTKLGFTSFGGPVAHLGYFKNEYIDKRKWLDDRTYADLIALCQFLPGPASSQVGISIGMLRGGIVGGILSWIGFTLPSVLALMIFAFLYKELNIENAGWIHGLKIVAVAVVAQAVFNMGQKLAPDKPRMTIAILAAISVLAWPTALGQIIIILVSAFIGIMLYKKASVPVVQNLVITISKRTALIAWGLFFAILIGLPLISKIFDNIWLSLFDTFYRVGSLVFGGGHVVLPLLEREVVPAGWATASEFLAGYGAAQAVPGPLFTFSSYLGAITNGWVGALIATVAIFLPSFLLVIGSLPFLESVRRRPKFQAALTGINAAVVGLLLAALYDPVWTSTINSTWDFSLALFAFALLIYWKVPAWAVVVIGVIGGSVLSALS